MCEPRQLLEMQQCLTICQSLEIMNLCNFSCTQKALKILKSKNSTKKLQFLVVQT